MSKVFILCFEDFYLIFSFIERGEDREFAIGMACKANKTKVQKEKKNMMMMMMKT